MKLSRTSLLLSLFVPGISTCVFAQTAAKPAVHTATGATHSTAAHTAAAPGGCAKIPAFSPKIPALPAGTPCAKTLYTITTLPSAKLENVSPMEWSNLHEALGMEPVSFSLNYVDVKVGTGELAAPKKWYSIHYSGYLVDGTKFDSSYDHPDHAPITIQIGVHNVIPGWDTGLAGMRIGGKRRLFIPFELAYGTANYPPNRPTVIPGKSELIFDVEFVAQSDKEPPPPPAPPAPPAAAPPSSSAPATPSATPSAPATAPAAPAPASSTPPPASSTPAAPPTPPKPQ